MHVRTLLKSHLPPPSCMSLPFNIGQLTFLPFYLHQRPVLPPRALHVRWTSHLWRLTSRVRKLRLRTSQRYEHRCHLWNHSRASRASVRLFLTVNFGFSIKWLRKALRLKPCCCCSALLPRLARLFFHQAQCRVQPEAGGAPAKKLSRVHLDCEWWQQWWCAKFGDGIPRSESISVCPVCNQLSSVDDECFTTSKYYWVAF